MTLYHFSGAGNNFIVLDGRNADMAEYRTPERIVSLCTQYHTDGLMILGEDLRTEDVRSSAKTPASDEDRSDKGVRQACRLHKTEGGGTECTHSISTAEPLCPEVGVGKSYDFTDEKSYDFTMEFFNPDGSGGMMCGNGGRCIAAFADYLGIRPSDGNTFHFLAPDGPHTAELLEKSAEGWTIRLQMKDVSGITPVLGGYFLDTGTRHYVRFVDDVETIDIETEGPRYRHDPAFAPVGANANFVQRLPGGGIKVRTFEKGVEGETLACGTGITASAIASWYDSSRHAECSSCHSELPSCHFERSSCHSERGEESVPSPESVHTPVRARQDDLCVDFTPTSPTTFTAVYLTGPAVLLAQYEW